MHTTASVCLCSVLAVIVYYCTYSIVSFAVAQHTNWRFVANANRQSPSKWAPEERSEMCRCMSRLRQCARTAHTSSNAHNRCACMHLRSECCQANLRRGRRDLKADWLRGCRGVAYVGVYIKGRWEHCVSVLRSSQLIHAAAALTSNGACLC